MLTVAARTRIFIVTGATDLRKSFDTLAAIVSGTLKEDPYSGHLYVFCNRLRNRLKILVWNRSGFWVLANRLEKGTFAWPSSREKTIDMTPEELSLLLGGIDLRGARRRPWYTRPDVKREKELVSSR